MTTHMVVTQQISRAHEVSGTSGKTLSHLAIIPDGNRRWAREHGLPRVNGHEKGFLDAALTAIEHAFGTEIETVTLWMFSEDNWNRSEDEIRDLMRVYTAFFEKLSVLMSQGSGLAGVRVNMIGRTERIPRTVRSAAEALCAHNQAGDRAKTLVLALDYGGRKSMVDAVTRLVHDHPVGTDLPPDAVFRALNGHGHNVPEIDMVLRTSGEHRLSGFMPFQSARAELLFLDKFFPDLVPSDIDHAIATFSARQQRRGG